MQPQKKSIISDIRMKSDFFVVFICFLAALLVTMAGLCFVYQDYQRKCDAVAAARERTAAMIEDYHKRKLDKYAVYLWWELNNLHPMDDQELPLTPRKRGVERNAAFYQCRAKWTEAITNTLSNVLRTRRGRRFSFPPVKAVFIQKGKGGGEVFWWRVAHSVPKPTVLDEGLKRLRSSWGDLSFGHWIDKRRGGTECVFWAKPEHESVRNFYCGFVLDREEDIAAVPEEGPSQLRLVGGFILVLLSGILLFVWPFTVALRSRAAWEESERKTLFVSNVSHELKTPLTSILGYAEMLESGLCRSEEKRRRALKVIGEEGRRLNRMVTELLEFSRLERGTSQYHPTEFDVSMVVEETVERLSSGFAEHGLHVRKSEGVWIVADCDKVKEILENLLMNARKYAAADGPVELSLERMSDCIRIHVCDRGLGMTENQRRHAFEPFWRADDAITKKTGGYGIGLPLARGYARGMGGDLTVSARAGGGCDFVLELPLKHETKEHENG